MEEKFREHLTIAGEAPNLTIFSHQCVLISEFIQLGASIPNFSFKQISLTIILHLL